MSHRFGPRTRLSGSGFEKRVAQWTQRSLVRSVQRGTIALTGVASNTAAITSVVLGNSLISWLAFTTNVATDTPAESITRIELTNATTVTATKGSGTNNTVVGYEVIEFWPGVLRSAQRGTIALGNAVATNTATITSVNTAKSLLTFLGWESTTNGNDEVVYPKIILTNATTVTADRNTSDAGTLTVGFQVAEYY